ncbi:hypothetical protein JCM19235_6143 [Vibrio maritimus]|uniref:Uncharacterized protein n=1 Tax=Vibrio maritimus TaxID=990268 RepID=A0A090RQB5_9VIBR|nr:hypothetical protein JCM19235_6143 [Vibrio maritimus]
MDNVNTLSFADALLISPLSTPSVTSLSQLCHTKYKNVMIMIIILMYVLSECTIRAPKTT